MRFDGSLGNMQIVSDFRVVTSLEQQIYDLPFPGTHLVELFFHKNCTWPMRPRSLQVVQQIRPPGTSGFGSLRLILHSRGQIGPEMLTNCKKSGCELFSLVKPRLLQCFPASTTVVSGWNYRGFAQHLG